MAKISLWPTSRPIDLRDRFWLESTAQSLCIDLAQTEILIIEPIACWYIAIHAIHQDASILLGSHQTKLTSHSLICPRAVPAVLLIWLQSSYLPILECSSEPDWSEQTRHSLSGHSVVAGSSTFCWLVCVSVPHSPPPRLEHQNRQRPTNPTGFLVHTILGSFVINEWLSYHDLVTKYYYQ